MDHAITTSVRSDRIGKVFRVVGRNMRQCLICDGLFTRHATVVHAVTVCLPSQNSFNLAGEATDANR